MAFIKLHSQDKRETLINTDNITFMRGINEDFFKTQMFFNVAVSNKIECLWVKVTETLDEVEEIIKKAEQEKYSGGKF